MPITHNLGFPRIGSDRELKKSLEHVWKGTEDYQSLFTSGKTIREKNWLYQKEAGFNFVSVGDFSWYDHVLDMSFMLNVIPERFQSLKSKNNENYNIDFHTYFAMARGEKTEHNILAPCEMTKWFDTNYHYIVPELETNLRFKITSSKIFDETKEALQLGYEAKPVLIGPLSYLWLSKLKTAAFNKLDLLPNLLETYKEILNAFIHLNVQWLQIDEPILVFDLPDEWKQAFITIYSKLNSKQINLLLTTYFAGLDDNLPLVFDLAVQGVHLDAVRAPNEIYNALNYIKPNQILSVGIVDGRNIWRANLNENLNYLDPLYDKLNERLWLAPSCSLLHCPVDLDLETELNPKIKKWFAFSKQKLNEISLLANGLSLGHQAIKSELDENYQIFQEKQRSGDIHKESVTKRVEQLTHELFSRHSPHSIRKVIQQEKLKLPMFPTTTVGSFPQTSELRALRQALRNLNICLDRYEHEIQKQIAYAVAKQDELDLDVYVHGEFERNDMVEYFADYLAGLVQSKHGWVQSYGSRCVKPPIIYGDIERKQPMTVEWSRYAQSLTSKPMKGMLTGPTTMLAWSFVRSDKSRKEILYQMALALRDEISDLEQAGIPIIQIDEPAFREALPLKIKKWPTYYDETISAFKLATCGVHDSTQIHSHMCYSEFNECINEIAELDADVITIEASRSHMELLEAFKNFKYPNDIGPGVYDVHSPHVPSVEDIVTMLIKAIEIIGPEQVWINPDCGLKTRNWSETLAALKNMTEAAKQVRKRYC